MQIRHSVVLGTAFIAIAAVIWGPGATALEKHPSRVHASQDNSTSQDIKIIQASILNESTTIQLPTGSIYFYGMVTGGALPTGPLDHGQWVQAVDTSGLTSAALAYSKVNENSYSTQTEYHAIGGVAVEGPWDVFDSFVSSAQQPGASTTTVNFAVYQDSLVVVIALASSQQSIGLQGVNDLQLDAVNAGPGTVAMSIAHAYLAPGAYSLTETSAATVPGQDPNNMVDLLGVFVLGSKAAWRTELEDDRSNQVRQSFPGLSGGRVGHPD